MSICSYCNFLYKHFISLFAIDIECWHCSEEETCVEESVAREPETYANEEHNRYFMLNIFCYA